MRVVGWSYIISGNHLAYFYCIFMQKLMITVTGKVGQLCWSLCWSTSQGMFNTASECVLPALISLVIFWFISRRQNSFQEHQCCQTYTRILSFVHENFFRNFVLPLSLKVLIYLHAMFVMKGLFLT